MVRGGCGGHSATTASNLVYTGENNKPSLGIYMSAGNNGGRGAKLIGRIFLKQGDILYLAVGCRGWCQDRSDYGATGGGASCVFRVNSNGQYTFVPTGEKVDVLFVAGGGGGAFDTSSGDSMATPKHNGQDASPQDGINTNAGSSSDAGGGGGLTSNSATRPGYSLLSGTPADSSNATAIHTGAWPGSGSSYDGGSGGSGYSGGDADNSSGGRGGTSYINSEYVTETFRGYEYNLELNPWSIPGSITIKLNLVIEELYFVKLNDNLYYYTDKWIKLEKSKNELTIGDIIKYGMGKNSLHLNKKNLLKLQSFHTSGMIEYVMGSHSIDDLKTLIIRPHDEIIHLDEIYNFNG